MSFLYLLFILLNVGRAFSKSSSLSLDLDAPDKVKFNIEETQLDNVFYRHFTPRNNEFVLRVAQAQTNVWNSSGYGRCVYALLAFKADPNLLYLKVDKGYTVEHKFYKRAPESWEEVSLDEYTALVYEAAKSNKPMSTVSVDLANVLGQSYTTATYSSKDRPYTFVTPNSGYLAESVVYNSHKLWSAKKFGDRCVAAWSHVKNGSYYMIRLLVTRYNDESEMYTYYLSDGKWDLVHVLYGFNEQYSPRPDNFAYPHYKFFFRCSYPPANLKEIDSSKVKEAAPDQAEEEDDSALDDTTESYFDMSGDYYKYKVHDDDEVNLDEPEPRQSVPKHSSLSDSRVFDLSFPKSSPPQLKYVDNVAYNVYKFDSKNAPRKIVDNDNEIWTAKKGTSEKCSYALSPMMGGLTVALYLVIDSPNGLRGAFFSKVGEKWVQSNLENYKIKLDFLKRFGTHYESSLDLSKKTDVYKYYVEYNADVIPSYMFLPRSGYSFSKVSFKDQKLWEAGENERCVAVWSHECMDRPYYVRFLVTKPSGEYDLVSFFNSRGSWEKYSSYNESVKNDYRFARPCNFYNPEYGFCHLPLYGSDEASAGSQQGEPFVFLENDHFPVACNREEAPKSSDADSKSVDSLELLGTVKIVDGDSVKFVHTSPVGLSEEALKDYAENKFLPAVPDDSLNTEYLEGKYNALPAQTVRVGYSELVREEMLRAGLGSYLRPFDGCKLMKIDLSNRLAISKFKLEAVFDNKLRLLSYHAPPGAYFDSVKESQNQLFRGTTGTTLCYAVNIYLKGTENYLCDLLVRNKDVNMTLYLKRDNGVWVYVDAKQYAEALDELKDHN